jgi:hypothetical protein
MKDVVVEREVAGVSARNCFLGICAMALFAVGQFTAMAQQPDPGAFVSTVRQAQERSQASDWRSAVPLWEKVVSTNPYVASSWYPLATAQYNAGEYRKAAASYEKAFDLGAGRLFTIALDVARSYAMLREKEPTLKWIARSIELGLRSRDRFRTDPAFEFLRTDPQYKKLAAEVDTSKMSRTEGWRYDLAFLAEETKRMHVSPFKKVSQAQFDGEVRKLHSDIPNLTDEQIITRLMRLMEPIGDGHTGIFPAFITTWRSAPLQLELFEEGMYVIGADPKYRDIVGGRVVKIGEHTPEDVIKTVAPIISKDSEQGINRSVVDFIRYPALLKGLGLLPQSESLTLTVRDAAGKTRDIAIPAVELPTGHSRIDGHPTWVTVHQSAGAPLPLSMKDRRTNYWFERLPNSKTVYFDFNLVVNMQAESLSAFLERFFRYVDENDIDRVIIDMRWNNGGNTMLMRPLVNGVISRPKINRPGRLFVVVSRYTFSAAVNVAAALEQNTNAILVGEPTPTGPNNIAESNIIILPYSGVRASISDIYWQNSWPFDTRTWIAPGLFVPRTFEAYKANRDPVMETILAYP